MLYTATTSFAYEDENGDTQVVQAGATVEDGHPMLEDRMENFVPLTVHFPRPVRVEQATAAPGEVRDVPVRRGPGRPRKDSR